MLFANKIRELRKRKQMLQRHVSAALDMDNAKYCKIEKGDRRAKREQIPMIAEIPLVNPEELLMLWMADQVIVIVTDNKGVVEKD